MKTGEDLVRVERARLVQDLTELRTRQVQRVPGLLRLMQDVDVEHSEKEALFLPSEYSPNIRVELKLEALAQVEFTLREVDAHNALQELRSAIRTLNVNYAVKKDAIHGTGANTRAQNFLKTLANDVKIAGSSYRIGRAAMVKLGLSEDDPVLRPLLKADMRGKDGKAQAAGQAKESDSWIWRAGRPANLSPVEEAEWNTEREWY